MASSTPCGIRCPECGSPTAVKQTRNRRGYIARRRACPQCGIRLSTAERIVGSGNGAINDRGVISDPHLSVILDRLEEIARRLR